jgi:acetolactate synthase-1/3 small subunit
LVILCALLDFTVGVLSRVTGVLAGRGFNIDSLVVSQTDVKDLSRMTVVLRGMSGSGSRAVEQVGLYLKMMLMSNVFEEKLM